MRNGRYIALPILFRNIASEKRIPHQKRSEDFECLCSFFNESALHPQPPHSVGRGISVGFYRRGTTNFPSPGAILRVTFPSCAAMTSGVPLYPSPP